MECIACYILEDVVSDRYLKKLPQIRLNFIYDYISSYCSILNSPKFLEQIRQTKNLTSFLCDLDSDHMREKEEKKKKATEAEENRIWKSEKKQVRENKYRLRSLEGCEDLVFPVLIFGMYHINSLKANEIHITLGCKGLRETK